MDRSATSSAWAKSTPLVPIELDRSPARVTPVPIAAAALSPPPAATGTPAPSPIAAATSRPDCACPIRPLHHVGEPLGRDLQRVEDLRGPVRGPQVEEEGAGRVGCVGRELARQAVPHVVLREQHVRHPGVAVRLLVAEPQHLGCLEPGERGVARDLDEPVGADPLGDLLALPFGALIVPEQRRTDHLARGVEEDRAVHLPREPDPDDGLPRGPTVRRHAAQHLDRGVPPCVGVLLGPTRPRRQHRVVRRPCGDDRPALVDRHSPSTGRADVDTDRDAHRVVAAFSAFVRFGAATDARSTSSVRTRPCSAAPDGPRGGDAARARQRCGPCPRRVGAPS